MSELLFKFTAPGRRPTHAGNGFVWPAPSGKRPGKWTDPVPSVVPCESGYHLTTAEHLLSWAHVELWVAEGRGKRVDAANKVAFESARLVRRVDAWNERTAREFACWCAEQSLQYVDDEALRAVCVETIAVSRAFAAGSATREQLSAAESAAGSAAESAAESAAWSAARSAAGSAAESAAESAAWSAAWSAAGSAAGSAAWSAARSAAWSAQTAHLLEMLGLTDD